ncbi:MAG: CoB--CoM heterodisulfide reductase iron-sulfur subunit B family protein [Nitrospiraceae bacterium]|jgi:succinate dehydrogenase / fumarate reductase cytochrome b subunit|nr:CoB--CoM heterodisulfide reductase iron-sulfur subunit B family protein [Nitrospiraceae bacterium]
MALRFALYPGCAAKGATPELYQSTMAIVGRLGIDVVELAASSCCGAGVVTEAEPDVALALNARNFAQAERLGLDIMTICGTCQGVMAAANKRLKSEPGLLDRINRVLEPDGIAYRGTIQVKHLLWIIVREIGLRQLGAQVVKSLQGLRIAPFYGCYILRPSWDLGFDDPENPTSLEQVIRALGGEAVAYAGRTKCCGFPIILEKEAVAMAMSGANMKEAKDQGADCMVTPCPLCHMSLDIYQDRAGQAVNTQLNLPILHLPQLLGLAMGIPAKELGLARHLITVDSIVRRINQSVRHS